MWAQRAPQRNVCSCLVRGTSPFFHHTRLYPPASPLSPVETERRKRKAEAYPRPPARLPCGADLAKGLARMPPPHQISPVSSRCSVSPPRAMRLPPASPHRGHPHPLPRAAAAPALAAADGALHGRDPGASGRAARKDPTTSEVVEDAAHCTEHRRRLSLFPATASWDGVRRGGDQAP
ncbi:hypothetical protein BS78_05G074600 [Paspalum vaginatum]|nr:hypothetical protein BS78_05G074600 [Paspalum vaginatum]